MAETSLNYDVALESIPQLTNKLGAAIFVSYIVLALVLTLMIVSSLRHDLEIASAPRRLSKTKTRVLIAIAVISFGTLSWHMSSFLVISYINWCSHHAIPLPNVPGHVQLWKDGEEGLFRLLVNLAEELWARLYLKEWAASSALFRDFAAEIQTGGSRQWWTSLALWWELGFAWWMASKGGRQNIPGLWMYFGLAQILPISFAQTLFFIRLFTLGIKTPDHLNAEAKENKPTMNRVDKKDTIVDSSKLTSRLPVIGLMLPVAYAVCLHQASSALEARHESTFIGLIFTLRLLLFAPYSLTAAHPSRYEQARRFNFWTAFLPIAFGNMCLKTWSVIAQGDDSVEMGLRLLRSALREGSAVAALGWDVILAVGSLFIWLCL